MKFRTIKKILIVNGFKTIVQSNTSHMKFYNDTGRHVCIPYHKEVNDMIWRRLVKENNIKL